MYQIYYRSYHVQTGKTLYTHGTFVNRKHALELMNHFQVFGYWQYKLCQEDFIPVKFDKINHEQDMKHLAK